MDIKRTNTNGRYYAMVKHVDRTRPHSNQDRGAFDRQVLQDKIDVLVAEHTSTTDHIYKKELESTIIELKELMANIQQMDIDSAQAREGEYVNDDDLPDEFSTLMDRMIAERAISNHINGFISHERCKEILNNLEKE